MPRIRTRYLDLAATFPKDDPLARLMMRAVVLWADARFELLGLRHNEDKGNGLALLDDVSPLYRRLFFFRASVRTLYSVLKLIKALETHQTFREWLAAPGFERWNGLWTDYRDQIRRMQSTIEADRNNVAAHAEEGLDGVARQFRPDDARFPVTYDQEWGLRTELGGVVLMLRLLGRSETDAELRAKVDAKFGNYAALLGPTMNLLGVACAVYSKWRADFLSPQQ